jgi:predicted HicB family RNase H-like nuclease
MTKKQEQKISVVVRVPKPLHRAAKLQFIREGTSFQQFFITQLQKAVPEGAA